MEKQNILEFLKFCNNFYITKMFKQYWREERYSYVSDSRPDFGLLFVLHGTAYFVSGGKTLTATSGNVIFLPKGSRYEAIFPEELEDYLVCFDCDGTNIDVDMPFKLIESAPYRCIEQFNSLIGEKISGNPESLRSKGLFYLLLDAIINNSEEENDTQRRIISRAKTLLVGKALSISEIAKECAMSDSGFRRIFKEQTGMTPVEYRISSRIKRAAYLLDSTGMSSPYLSTIIR